MAINWEQNAEVEVSPEATESVFTMAVPRHEMAGIAVLPDQRRHMHFLWLFVPLALVLVALV